MFLTNATISELQLLDIPLLVEMLAQHTTDYVQLIKEEGFTARTAAAKQALLNIQSAIENKKMLSTTSLPATPLVSSPANDTIQGIQKS